MATYGKELKESFITRMPAQNISEAELTRKQKSVSTHYIDRETMQKAGRTLRLHFLDSRHMEYPMKQIPNRAANLSIK